MPFIKKEAFVIAVNQTGGLEGTKNALRNARKQTQTESIISHLVVSGPLPEQVIIFQRKNKKKYIITKPAFIKCKVEQVNRRLEFHEKHLRCNNNTSILPIGVFVQMLHVFCPHFTAFFGCYSPVGHTENDGLKSYKYLSN